MLFIAKHWKIIAMFGAVIVIYGFGYYTGWNGRSNVVMRAENKELKAEIKRNEKRNNVRANRPDSVQLIDSLQDGRF